MDIAPFHAIRYATSGAGELDLRVSLPYDQFGDQGRDERYRRHPHNVVRLIKPRPGGGEPHEAARQTLDRWRDEGVLRLDEQASLYPYRQVFSAPGAPTADERWSLICRLRLTPFDAGPLKPHERTYPGPVGERSRLRERVGADLGLILVIYDDPDGEIDAEVRRAAGKQAVLEARDEGGTANAVWKWSGDDRIERVGAALAGARGFIADGHHRYTAALGHWQANGAREDDPAGWVMAALVSASSPGLCILPTHRLVGVAPDDARTERWRAAGLDIVPLPAGPGAEQVVEAARQALEEATADHAIVVVRRTDRGVGAELLRARRGSLAGAAWPPSVPSSWRDLDVPVLHSLLLDPWLGAALDDQTEDHGVVDYCNEHLEAVRAVASGEQGSAFLLNPLTIGEVQKVVAAGDVLPQKSTNFYPKVIAGLTVHSFAEETPGKPW